MARRRRQSILEDLVEIAVKLPWKDGLALAVASYLIMHAIAEIQVDRPANFDTMGDYAGKQFMVTIAAFGHFIQIHNHTCKECV